MDSETTDSYNGTSFPQMLFSFANELSLVDSCILTSLWNLFRLGLTTGIFGLPVPVGDKTKYIPSTKSNMISMVFLMRCNSRMALKLDASLAFPEPTLQTKQSK